MEISRFRIKNISLVGKSNRNKKRIRGTIKNSDLDDIIVPIRSQSLTSQHILMKNGHKISTYKDNI